MTNITIIGSFFNGRNREGDFNFMIEENLRRNIFDCLFIFNDNIEDHETSLPGGGNASVRKYNKYNESGGIPLSAGIPTGTKASGGFTKLDYVTRAIINAAFEEVKELLELYEYKTLYFSISEDGLIGSGIFQIGLEVRKYITDKIESLSIMPIQRLGSPPEPSRNFYQKGHSFATSRADKQNSIDDNFPVAISESKGRNHSIRETSEHKGINESSKNPYDDLIEYDNTKCTYSASGIFLYRLKGENAEVLLGNDLGWNILGGKRDNDYHPYVTAAREFHEETGGILSSNEKSILGRTLSNTFNNDVQRFYIPEGKYCLFTLNISAIPDTTMQNTLHNIVNKFSDRSWYRLWFMSYKYNEMSKLRWVRFHDLLSPMLSSNFHSFTQVIINKSGFKRWLSDTNHRLTGQELCYKPKEFIPNNGSPFQSSSNKSVTNEPMIEAIKVGILFHRYNPSMDANEFLVKINQNDAYEFICEESASQKTISETERAIKAFNLLTKQALSSATMKSISNMSRGDDGNGVQRLCFNDDQFVLMVVSTKHLGSRGENEIHSTPTKCKDHAILSWISFPESIRELTTEYAYQSIGHILQSDIFQCWHITVLTQTTHYAFLSMNDQANKLLETVMKEKGELERWISKNSQQLQDIPDFCAEKEIVDDIIILEPDSKEYQSVMTRVQKDGPLMYPVHCVKKIKTSKRHQRFDAYKLSLNDRMVKDAYHGTPQIDWAVNIVRRGPDISKAGTVSGKSEGCGFYTALTSSISEPYTRGTGSLCVIKIAPGKTLPNGNHTVTAETLTHDGYDSVYHESLGYHIMFHPDSVKVEYVIDHSSSTLTGMSSSDYLKYQAWRKRKRDRDTKELVRSNTMLKYQSQLQMIDYMIDECRRIKSIASPDSVDNIRILSRNFDLNRQQYDTKLPLFAHKKDIMNIMKQSQLMILKGDPGIGKTVLLPQWLYDEYLSLIGNNKKVAVLLPRRAIAEGLYSYLTQCRKCPNEIGIGTSEETKLYPETKIVFFTYGYFKQFSYNDQEFSQWGVILFDEAHERNKDAVDLMIRVALACSNRKDLKTIVMSATIDSNDFSTNFIENIYKYSGERVSCPIKEVKGFNYQVEDIWWDKNAWNPSSIYAVRDLCIETLCIFNKETELLSGMNNDGNLLVFVPSIQLVHDCCELMKHMLKHDEKTFVFPLYASVHEEIRFQIEKFNEFHQDSEERFICFCTNVAEAGITIPGITAVIDTGIEIIVTWNNIIKADVRSIGWISKASRTQRRGRAGRTAPGRFYSLYSQEDYEKEMSEYSIPPLKKTNIETFYLGLLANGVNPHESAILDNPIEELEYAKASLITLGAITVNPTLTVTSLGRAMSCLPVDLNMAKSIIYSAKVVCVNSMSIVASVCYSCDSYRTNIYTSKDDFIKKSNKVHCFQYETGDHELYLSVYNQWIHNNRSNSWCNRYSIHSDILYLAETQLGKIHRVLQQCDILPYDNESYSSIELNNLILQSLCYGYCDNACIAMNPNNLSDGFRMIKGYNTNPIIGQIHSSSIITRSEQNIQTILYRNRLVYPNGSNSYYGISIINETMLLQASKDILTEQEFLQLKSNITNMQMIHETITLPKYKRILNKREYLTFQMNLKDIKKQNPLYKIKMIGDLKSNNGKVVLSVTCPNKTIFHRLIDKIENICMKNALEISYEIDNVENIERYIQKDNSLQIEMQKIRNAIRKRFNDDESIHINGDRGKRILIISAVPVIAYSAYVHLCQLINIPVKKSNPNRLDMNLNPNPFERRKRYDLLFDRNTSIDIIRNELNSNISGTLFAICHYLLWNTTCFVYGGYIRDYLEAGQIHDDMDLDVGLSILKPCTLQSISDLLVQWTNKNNIQFIKQISRGPVLGLEFQCFDRSLTCSVELVDTQQFTIKDNRVDFDVNNLMIMNHNNELRLTKKHEKQGDSIVNILKNIERMQLIVLKPVNEITARIAKMRDRGWTINYSNDS